MNNKKKENVYLKFFKFKKYHDDFYISNANNSYTKYLVFLTIQLKAKKNQKRKDYIHFIQNIPISY